jgi:hypothetical protein
MISSGCVMNGTEESAAVKIYFDFSARVPDVKWGMERETATTGEHGRTGTRSFLMQRSSVAMAFFNSLLKFPCEPKRVSPNEER